MDQIVNVAEVIEKSRDLFEEFKDSDKTQLVVETPLPDVKADPARVLTVFQNLMSNGLKYNQSNPKIIRVGFADQIVMDGGPLSNVFYVSDNGIGIDARYHEKVFEIFTRLNAESSFGQGTGAGLAFVQRIIEEQKGDLTIRSAPGEGSTFYFPLPMAG